MVKKIILGILLGGFWLALIFLAAQFSRAQSSTGYSATSSPDAIAIRVVPNPEHYSIDRWYAGQGFQGSPQALIVDGYQAIRDGRTVYVDATNVDQTASPPLIYTNIYLISYNQNPEPNTVDILGQIISHWTFNNNLIDSNPAPQCILSSGSCASNADCGSGQYCATSGVASSSCQLVATTSCLTDTDCPTGFFCDSLKAKIARDVKRVGELSDLGVALDNFKNANGHYPALNSGTYVTHNSLSVWPSWTEVLLTDLAAPQSAVDPINHLGTCPGYDAKTCWNQSTKRFFRPSTGQTAPTLVLPDNSYAFAYATNNTGSDYNLCATLETRAAGLNYHFSPNDPAGSACVLDTGVNTSGQIGNANPEITAKMLTGVAGQEFDGFVQASDPDGDPLTWTLNTAAATWTGWQNGGQTNQPPILLNTSSAAQKKIYAQAAGRPGNYNIILTLNDGRGGVLTTSTPITILSPSVSIQADNANYVPQPTVPFDYNMYIAGKNGTAFSVDAVTLPSSGVNLLALPTVARTVTQVGANLYQVNYHGLVSSSVKLATQDAFQYRVSVTNSYGQVSTKNFTITVGGQGPQFTLNCPTTARVNQAYNCTLPNNSSVVYTDSDGRLAALGLYLSGNTIAGAPNKAGAFPLSVTATSDYGVSSVQGFTLSVDSYCGDGLKESPNSEGRGGVYNNGYEDCDGTDGLTASTTLSNIGLQYGCQTDQCVYKGPLNGGGYCGDGYCQTTIDGQPRENCLTCAADCGNCVATIESYSNNEQIAYFNGNRIYKSVWPDEGSATATLATGKNVAAFWIHALNTTNPNYGLAYRLSVGPVAAPYDVIDSSSAALSCAVANNASNNLSSGNYDPANELSNGGYPWTSPQFSETGSFHSSRVIAPRRASSLNSAPFVWGQVAANPIPTAFYCRLTYNYSLGNLGVCHPHCQGLQCGSDGCGGTCGSCGSGQVCSPAGQCVNVACSTSSQCDDGNMCTDDTCVNPGLYNAVCNHTNNSVTTGCNSTFGTCTVAGEKTCSNGSFGSCNAVDPRPTTCYGKTCGSDGCGGVCGTCDANQNCVNGSCVYKCMPDCDGKCDGAPDGCNGVCKGACPAGEVCTNQKCQAPCTPKCAGKCAGESDGCSGTCPNTGNNTGCVSSTDIKTCNAALGYAAGFIGNAPCNSTCSGYDTSACTIDTSYWYKAPDETVAYPGRECMVKMNINGNGTEICSDAGLNNQAQWFRGTIAKTETTYCSTTGCPSIVNPDKCRYYANYWQKYCQTSQSTYNAATCATYCPIQCDTGSPSYDNADCQTAASKPQYSLCFLGIWANQCYVHN